jgi:transposase-like protein
LTNDDVIHRSRLRLFALAREMGSVRAACRLLGVHHSTYYRWRRQLVRFGAEDRKKSKWNSPLNPAEEAALGPALLYNPAIGG